MTGHDKSATDQLTYQSLKGTIEQTYPRGWFVAIADDQLVGAAKTFRDLERSLQAKGKDPRTVLVVEAGVDVPDYVTIFA
jgi:hypothetical protein